MKIYLYFIIPAIAFVFNGCKKDVTNNVNVPIIPSVTVQSVNYPSFANSPWSNVAGGTVLFKFDLLNASNAVVSSYKDSIDVKNISNYNKTLDRGTYNIYLSSKNQTTADTFIRFNAKVSAYSVTDKQALSLTATTSDGLITIGQSFVQSNTIPTFKSDSGSTVYKFGLINGFYYLYVKGGTKGAITFTSKPGNQVITKSLSVTTLNQYNLEVQTNKGSLQVVFTLFAYNQVAVSSSTLLTVNVDQGDYYFKNSNVYFVATDESGNVLNSVQYKQGTTSFKFSTHAPYEKDRFNFFVIIVPTVSGFNTSITCFLQGKKGSTYNDLIPMLAQKGYSPLKPHLKNSSGFDYLNISTDVQSRAITTLADSSILQQLVYPGDSTKLYVQMLKNNQYSYNFFAIPKGSADVNVDLTQLTKTPLVKNISAPADNFYVSVYAKADVNYADAYRFGTASSTSNTADFYYPKETFPEYDIMSGYTIGAFKYTFDSSGTTIPSQVPTFSASFTVTGSTLVDFMPSCSGTFDYYHANFLNSNSGANLQVDLYSPSAANYTNIKFPDFSKYLGVTTFDFSSQKLQYFELEQYDGFNEQSFNYKNVNAILSFSNFNCKSVMQTY
jgi:hypothetical protein